MRYPQRKINYELKINNSSGQIGTIIFFLFLAFFCIFIGKFTVLQSPILVLGLVGGLIISLITLVNTNLALTILIFSMLLSPEIPIAKVPERAVVIRIDDILLIFMFFTWLAKTAINKELGLLRKTPINRPLFIYVLLCVIITPLAIILGIGKARFLSAFFYILKYIEYFLLFFLVSSNLRNLKQVKRFTVCLLLVCFIIGIYGYWQMRTGTIRLSAPFEGKKPEPNTLAGYLLVIFGIIGGLLLHSQSPRSRFILGGLFLFIFPVFLFTLSRAGYTGFIGLYLAFLIFTKKARLLLIAVLLISLFILPLVLPLAVIERVKTTFNPSPAEALHYNALGQQFTLEESAAQRIETWKWVIPLWQRSPFFGYGVTGVGFVDSQYTRVLGELGIIGFLVFFWLIFVLFRETLRTYRCSTDSWIKGLSLGFLASLVALLMDGIGANVFIIVRVMEPFWFIAAMVLMAPQIEEEVSPITQ